MNPRTPLPLLLVLSCCVHAEDQPVPPPPPKADPTATVPPPPPTADPTVPAPAPAPKVDGGGVTPPAPSPTPGAGGRERLAAAAGRAAAQEQSKPLSLRLEVDAGYDSNVLREDTNAPTATNSEGFALGGELHGTWRAIREPQGQLNVIADLRYNNYPDQSRADLGRAGIALFGLLRTGFIDPGVVLGANRQWIDGEGAAVILRATALATHLSGGREHFDSVALDGYRVDYDDNDAASGVLGDVLWRHWWMPEPGNARRRVELTVLAGLYDAKEQVESYTTIKPGLGVLYRLGDGNDALGVWDLQAQTSLDLRHYDEGLAGESAERQSTWQLSGAADRWFGSWFSAGPFITYSIRNSTRDGRDYDRVQVGARLTAEW